jgi:hypothetical protein
MPTGGRGRLAPLNSAGRPFGKQRGLECGTEIAFPANVVGAAEKMLNNSAARPEPIWPVR